MKAFSRFLALALIAAAQAQAGSTSIKLGWTAPTKHTDSSNITLPLTYNLWEGASSTTLAKVGSGITGTTTVVTNATSGNCFAVSAVEVQGATTTESALSTVACALIPGAPSGLTVSVTLTVQ